jgi:hypothetical protein
MACTQQVRNTNRNRTGEAEGYLGNEMLMLSNFRENVREMGYVYVEREHTLYV